MKDVVEEFVCVQKLDNNLRRTQKRLRRVINSNLGQYEEQDKFLTLTCPKLKSREKACRMFKTFDPIFHFSEFRHASPPWGLS